MHEDITDNLNLQGTLVTGNQHTKNSISVKIQCIKRTNNMSSSSPTVDGTRKSPVKKQGKSHTTWLENTRNTRGGKEGRGQEVL